MELNTAEARPSNEFWEEHAKTDFLEKSLADTKRLKVTIERQPVTFNNSGRGTPGNSRTQTGLPRRSPAQA
jgi:hypothetical protein